MKAMIATALLARGTERVVSDNPTPMRLRPFDRARNLVERTFCGLEDWRRLATRYDKLATNFDSAATTAAIVFW